jgi:hypothetical protein
MSSEPASTGAYGGEGVVFAPDGSSAGEAAHPHGRRRPDGQGLANLGGTYEFPRSFVGGPTVVGQRAALLARRLEISSSAARTCEDAGPGD